MKDKCARGNMEEKVFQNSFSAAWKNKEGVQCGHRAQLILRNTVDFKRLIALDADFLSKRV